MKNHKFIWSHLLLITSASTLFWLHSSYHPRLTMQYHQRGIIIFLFSLSLKHLLYRERTVPSGTPQVVTIKLFVTFQIFSLCCFLISGHGFGSQFYLFLFDGSPFNLCNLLVRFSSFLVFNIFTNWKCVLYMYSELHTCTNIHMLFNGGATTTGRCKIKYAIYIDTHTLNHAPFQMYKCCLAMLSRQLNSSTIGTLFFLTLRRSFYKFSNVQVWS